MAGPSSSKSIVEGSAVSVGRNSGFKIGYINHSSNVAFRRNVSYQIDGSHFFTEEGDEVGEFVENLAIYSKGGGFPKDMQMDEPCNKTKYPDVFNRRRLDVGHRGHGFWLQAGGVEVSENVSAEHGSSTFDLWPRALNYPKKSNTHLVQFPVGLLQGGGAWANSQQFIGIDFVPAVWRDNIGYVTSGAKKSRNAAISIHYSGIKQKNTFPASPKTLISGFKGWNTQNGIVASYTGWIRFEDIEFIAGEYERRQTVGMVLGTQGGNNMDLVNVFLDGFKVPLKLGKDSTCLNVIADGVALTCGDALTTGGPILEPEMEEDGPPEGEERGPGQDAPKPKR
jgi:hypothetical protein